MPKQYASFILLLLAILLCSCGSSGSNSGSSDGNVPPLSLAAAASRTSGVAPLLIHFNADLESSTASQRSFHDHEYSWDFGDPGAGSWGTSGASKNSDKGPVAAHLFETPGTYTVNLTVSDGSATIDSKSFSITVTDPDMIFAGAATTCISDSSHNDFSGCPAGATQLVSDDLTVLGSYATTGSRILLQRGSSWSLSSTINYPWSDAGPVLISAYGTCQSPDDQGICSNAPQVNMGGDISFLSLERKQNWRLTDISFSGTAANQGAITGAINIQQFLGLRLETTGFRVPLGWSHWRGSDSDVVADNGLVSCQVSDPETNGMYVGAERLALLGNVVADAQTSHVCRVWQSYLGVISHNSFSGSSLTNTAGRHALKFHGPAEDLLGNYAKSSGEGLRFRSRFTVLADNIFGSSGPWPVAIGPQDTSNDERLSDILFEKNRLPAQYGSQSATPVQVSALFCGRYMTVRNNIIDGSGAANGYTGLFVWHRGDLVPPPQAIHIYHNTIYRSDTSPNGITGIQVAATATDTTVRNNLISFPGESRQTLLNDESTSALASHNILTDTPAFADPDNATPLARDFSLSASSTAAIDQGTPLPVFDDFFGTLRTGEYDVGACAY